MKDETAHPGPAGGPDLTQKEVAAYLHCDQSLYSKYERGERLLPLDRAVQLADYYGVTLDYLTGRTDTP